MAPVATPHRSSQCVRGLSSRAVDALVEGRLDDVAPLLSEADGWKEQVDIAEQSPFFGRYSWLGLAHRLPSEALRQGLTERWGPPPPALWRQRAARVRTKGSWRHHDALTCALASGRPGTVEALLDAPGWATALREHTSLTQALHHWAQVWTGAGADTRTGRALFRAFGGDGLTWSFVRITRVQRRWAGSDWMGPNAPFPAAWAATTGMAETVRFLVQDVGVSPLLEVGRIPWVEFAAELDHWGVVAELALLGATLTPRTQALACKRERLFRLAKEQPVRERGLAAHADTVLSQLMATHLGAEIGRTMASPTNRRL